MRTLVSVLLLAAAASAGAQTDGLAPTLPRLVHLTLPVRPPGASDSATVRLRVRVDAEGRVASVQPADPRLARLPGALADTLVARAQDAVQRSRFAPGMGPNGPLGGVRFLVVPFAAAPTREVDLLTYGQDMGTFLSECTAVTVPVKRSGMDPQYPDHLRRDGVSGRVVVRALVGVDGRTVQAFVQRSDHPSFGAASVAAINTWTFTPATCGGAPIAVFMTIPIRFRTLDGGSVGGLDPAYGPQIITTRELPFVPAVRTVCQTRQCREGQD